MEAVIHQTAQLDCSPAEAFRYFTENEKLETFFSVEADVDPRIGGKYELSWDPDHKPNDSTVGCQITALEEGRLLAFDWKGPTEFASIMNESDPLTHVVLFFYPDPSGGCQVHLVHSGWRKGEDWMAARQYFDSAWSMVLGALKQEGNGG
ncbi:MAG: SRPBCC domain-containing protein [Anaerolineales bacterium]